MTDELFAAFWPTAPTDEGFADRMDALPKYVVSKSLRTAGWQNSIVIGGNPAEKIAELQQQSGGGMLRLGSADLLNSLIKHDLIDEYRIMVVPVVLGSGKRLFRDATDITHVELVDTRTFESGVTVLTYRPADRTVVWSGRGATLAAALSRRSASGSLCCSTPIGPRGPISKAGSPI